MSYLLRRTKKSCLKFLRKISTSKQLFVQRLDEDEEDEDEMEKEEEQPVQQQQIDMTNDEQYSSNNNLETSVQCLEYAYDLEFKENELEKEQETEKEKEEQLQQTEKSLNVQFDLMHYKENVRYLRHTPSNSSLDLQLEQQQQQQQLQLREVTTTMPIQRTTCSVSVGSKFDGNYHNVIIMEQPPNDDYPIVKWDINGNSLDEEHFDLRQHWDAFDNRWRQLQSLQGKRLGSGQSQRSSHHSSSCTLETWIDDAELGLCDESQNLLQTNNHNNNCNQCLKSF